MKRGWRDISVVPPPRIPSPSNLTERIGNVHLTDTVSLLESPYLVDKVYAKYFRRKLKPWTFDKPRVDSEEFRKFLVVSGYLAWGTLLVHGEIRVLLVLTVFGWGRKDHEFSFLRVMRDRNTQRPLDCLVFISKLVLLYSAAYFWS